MQKVLLVVVVLALLAAGGVTLFAGNDAPGLTPDSVVAPDDAASAPGAAEAAPTAKEGTPANAAVDASSARAEAAAFDERTQRPLPDDAKWVEVAIVDKATRSPQAGAVVHWVDESAHQHLEEIQHPERSRLNTLTWRTEYFAEIAGWRTRADHRGIARVTLRSGTTVAAQHGGMFGRLTLQPNKLPPPGGHVLELEPDLSLMVRVVDDAGAPCADVPVTLFGKRKDQIAAHLGWSMRCFTRSPDGLATLPHLQAVAAEHGGDDTETTEPIQWFVRTAIAGFADPGVAFDLRNPPTEPIELRLPPCGSMRVRAEFAGKPAPGFRVVWLNHETQNNEEQHYSWSQADVGTDGTARFPYLPLAQRFHVNANALGGVGGTYDGPVHRGQEVEIVLRPHDNAMLLSGRLLTAERQPLADRELTFRLRGPELHQHTNVRTDGDGRFVVNAGTSRKENRADQIWFELRKKGEMPMRAEIAPRTLRPGVEELGDVAFGDGKLIVAGSVVCGGQPYTEPCWVNVQREEAVDGNPNRRWRRVEALSHKDEQGAFVVRGDAPPGRYRLTIGGERLPQTEPIEFTVGTKDLVVTVEPGHTLLASVLLPKQAPTDALAFQLVPAKQPAAPAPNDVPQRDRLRRSIEDSDKHRHHVRWQGLPAGDYALDIVLSGAAKPLLSIPGIVLPAANDTDPRLVDIDLRSLLRVVALTLRDANGKEIENDSCMVFPGEQANADEWVGQHAWSGQPRLLLPPGPYELLVCVGGFRPQPVRGESDAVTVQLMPWPTLVVRVADIPKLPPKARVQVSLQPTTTSELRYRSSWSSGSRSEYLEPPRRSVTVADGKAEVPIGDGLYSIRLAVSANRKSHSLTGIEPAQVLSTAGEVTVRAPQEQWTKAFEVVSQPQTQPQPR